MPSGIPAITLNVQNIIDLVKEKNSTDPSVLQFLRGNMLLSGKKVNSLIFILQYANKQQNQDLSRCVLDLLLNKFDELNESDWRQLSDEQIPAIIYFLSLLLFQNGLYDNQQIKIYPKLPEYGMDIGLLGFTILNKCLSHDDQSKFQPVFNVSLFRRIFDQYLNSASVQIMIRDAINYPKFYPNLYVSPFGRLWTNACLKQIIEECRNNKDDYNIAPLINTFLEMACLAVKERDRDLYNYLFEFLLEDAHSYFLIQNDGRFSSDALPIWKLIHLKSFAPADYIEPVDALLYFCIENSNLSQFLALGYDNGVSKNGVQLLLEMTDRDPKLVESFLLRFMGELNITHIAHTIEGYEDEDLNNLLEQLNTSLITKIRLITHPDLYLWVQQLLVQMKAIEYPIYVDNYYDENLVVPVGARLEEPVQSINPYQLHLGFFESQETYSWGRSIIEPLDESSYNLAFDFNAGIHNKYLGGHLPSIPRLVAASSRPGPTPHQRIPFIRLADVIQPNVNRTPYSIDYNGLTADFYSYDGKEITREDNVTFVCAGRKENALLPPVTQGGRIVAVLTENELGNLAGLPDGYDILVIKGLQSNYYGNYNNLGAITSRRIGIFLFAAFCNLPIIMMLDDNIKEVTFEEGNLSIFHYLARQFKNEVCLTVPTKSYSASEASKKELGSKFFMIRLDRVRARLDNDQLLYLLFPEAKCVNYWGEDYYLQIMLDALIPGQEALVTLPQEHIALMRSRQHTNAFLKTGKKAELLPELPIDVFYQFPPEIHRLLSHAISAFNRIVTENEQRYQNKLSYIESMDLGSKHTQANGLNHLLPELRDAVNDDQMEVSAPETPNPYAIPIEDMQFRERFKYFTQRTEFKRESLRKYQQEAIRQVCTMQEQKGSLIMATGTGKTRTQCDLARLAYHAAIDGEAIFIVTPFIKLVDQFFNGFVDYNMTSSAANVDLRVPIKSVLKISSDGKSCNLSLLIQNSKWKEGKSILIFCQASFDKLLAEHPDLMEHCALLLLDEYHEYPKTIEALDKHSEAHGYSPFVIGSTATPHPEVDLKPVYTYNRAQGVAEGVLAAVMSDTLGQDYSDSNLDGVINTFPYFLANLVHPGFIDGRTLTQTRGIIFLPSIKHCDQLERVLNDQGIRCHAIHSKNTKNRDELEKYLAHREPTVLLAVEMLGVGFDDPSLSWIILATPQLKPMYVEQMVGRVMRRDGAKIGYVLGFNSIIESVRSLLKSHPQDVSPLNDHYYGQRITCGNVIFTTGVNPEENEESKKRLRVETADDLIESIETDPKRAKKGLGFFAPQPSVIKENISSQTNYRVN
jgi:superfamily II DNA or RNA helicase